MGGQSPPVMIREHRCTRALSRVVITSVGPLTSEELRGRGLSVDIECTRPKMGFLVQEAAEKSAEIVRAETRAALCSNGGSVMSALYPLFLSLRGGICVVVDGSEMAEAKVRELLQAGANVRVIARVDKEFPNVECCKAGYRHAASAADRD